MAIVRKKELVNLSKEELNKKLEEIKLESIKATKPGHGTAIKTKEIKRTVARILTYLKQKNGNLS